MERFRFLSITLPKATKWIANIMSLMKSKKNMESVKDVMEVTQ